MVPPFSHVCRFLLWSYLGLCCLALGACIDPFAVDLGETTGRLLVQGRIHAGPGPYLIEIRQVANFGSPVGAPVVGALVELLDDEDRSERAVEVAPGQYAVPGAEITGVVGGQYSLRISLPDGRIIRSQAERLPPLVQADSLEFVVEDDVFESESGQIATAKFIKLSVNTPTEALPAEPGPFLRWETSEMYMFVELDHPDPRIYPNICYITKPIPQNPIRLFSRRENPVDRWDGQLLVQRRIDWEFEFKHYFTVHQLSTTEAAHRYWTALDRISAQSGSLLDIPPAPVQGNLYDETNPQEQVLGFFEAVSIDTLRLFTLKTDFVGFNFLPYCWVDYSRFSSLSFGYPPACYACWQLPGSSFERPSWW